MRKHFSCTVDAIYSRHIILINHLTTGCSSNFSLVPWVNVLLPCRDNEVMGRYRSRGGKKSSPPPKSSVKTRASLMHETWHTRQNYRSSEEFLGENVILFDVISWDWTRGGTDHVQKTPQFQLKSFDEINC